MDVAYARDTLEVIETTIKERILTDEDLLAINRIIQNRINKKLEGENNNE